MKKFFLLLLIGLFSCSLRESLNQDFSPREDGGGEAEGGTAEAPAGAAEAPRTAYLTLLAAGDNLYHNVMIRPGPEGGYDFTGNYSEIKFLIKAADIAFVNQETLLGGEEYGFSGYPRFNSPRETGDALRAAGFDVINHATNHIMDKGEGAVFTTMAYWDSIPGIRYLGIYKSQAERRTKRVIIKKNGIKTGFLAYTYGTNGLAVPRDKPYLVSLINDAVMEKEIRALRPFCDFLVVSMHWGQEYQHTISREQERLSHLLAGLGVDLIIGHHPHVVQRYSYLKRPGGGRTLCFYSLGNFLSAQDSSATQLGALAYVRLKKTGPVLSIEEEGIIPTVNHYENNYSRFRVYPLFRYTEELAKKHLLRLAGKEISVSWFTALAENVFSGKNILLENPFIRNDQP
jgi:poly-gamma-glutamate synthesis protein (capsule biosynthesis protein)